MSRAPASMDVTFIMFTSIGSLAETGFQIWEGRTNGRKEWDVVRVASAVTSLLAEVHGTGSTGRSSIRVPTSGLGGSVYRVLISRNCMGGFAIVRSNGRNIVGMALGCASNGAPIVANLHHMSGPNLEVCDGTRSVPGMVGNLNVTVVSASGNIVASHRTEGRRVNNRILTCV